MKSDNDYCFIHPSIAHHPSVAHHPSIAHRTSVVYHNTDPSVLYCNKILQDVPILNKKPGLLQFGVNYEQSAWPSQ